MLKNQEKTLLHQKTLIYIPTKSSCVLFEQKAQHFKPESWHGNKDFNHTKPHFPFLGKITLKLIIVKYTLNTKKYPTIKLLKTDISDKFQKT